MTHYIVVREDSPGKFTAYPCGLPELSVTAPSRAEAVANATSKLNDWLVTGRLVQVRLPGFCKSPAASLGAPTDSDDFAQRAFDEAIERSRREDLERTLAEYEAECQATSSTPTS